MSYAPQGTIKPFIEAVRAEPARVWCGKEAAQLMDVQESRVSAWLEYAVRQKAVYRGRRDGKTVYCGMEFPPEAAFPLPSERNGQVGSQLQVPRFGDQWRAPQMVAPRPGSDVPAPSRAPGPPPASQTLCTGCTRDICREKGCWSERAKANISQPPPTPTRTPAPVEAEPVAEAPIEEEAAVVEEAEEEEAIEPDAFVSCRTGEIVLIGLEPDPEGRITIPADLVALIKQQITWSPAR